MLRHGDLSNLSYVQKELRYIGLLKIKAKTVSLCPRVGFDGTFLLRAAPPEIRGSGSWRLCRPQWRWSGLRVQRVLFWVGEFVPPRPELHFYSTAQSAQHATPFASSPSPSLLLTVSISLTLWSHTDLATPMALQAGSALL